MKILWTYELFVFIKCNLHLSDEVLGEYLGVSKSSVKSARLRYSLLRLKPPQYTPEEDETLNNTYPNTRTDKIARQLGRSITSVHSRAHLLGLKKSEEFMASIESGILVKGNTIGKATRFKKGDVSHNKGEKMSPEMREKVKHTFFKKGHKPANTLFDGAIRIRKRSKRRGGKMGLVIRIGPMNWVDLKRYLWEEAYGPIQKGMCIAFKDGDLMNCTLNNLKMITNKENMKRNSLHYNYPEELVKVIQMKGALKAKITRLTKKHNNGTTKNNTQRSA